MEITIEYSQKELKQLEKQNRQLHTRAFTDVYFFDVDEFQIQKEEGFYLFLSKDKCYKVIKYDELYKELDSDCNNAISAAHAIPFEYIINSAEFIHIENKKEFYENFQNTNPTLKEKELFKTILDNSQNKDGNDFWAEIDSADEDGNFHGEFYGKCILAILKTYDRESVLSEIFEELTDDGYEIYCEIKNGDFESINIPPKDTDDSDGGYGVDFNGYYNYDNDIIFFVFNVDVSYFNENIMYSEVLIEKIIN